MSRVAAAVLTVLVLSGLVSCAQAGVTSEDAYAVGCPAVDAAVAGGSVAGSATVAGLKALRDSGQLGPEPQRWLGAAIDVIERPDTVSPEAKQLILDGCAKHGYPLRNLR